MKSNIIKADDLPVNESVYLKKSMGNYRVVYPIKNDDGSINWFNLLTGGSWFNVIVIGVVVAIILALLFEYSSNVKLLQEEVASCWCLNPL